ncbi:MAG: hypothetical protein HN576_03730 [Bacteriovoracaceae bacterium]|jgi:hypothetical protein|nr:hypothetical protein [Bacteriovoracaceae bacterium]
MKNRLRSVLLSSLMFITPMVFSSEIDSFHGRFTKLKDSTEALNIKTNILFKDAIKNANKKMAKLAERQRRHTNEEAVDIKCSEKILYKSMRRNFRNHYTGKLNPWIIKSKRIDKVIIPVTESIYQDFKWFEAYVPGLFARVFKDPSAMLLRVGDVLVGNDKFEHFLGSGFTYFETHHLEKKSIKEALRIGWKAETGLLGANTTGVMAYADMLANFSGMRFWNHILANDEDVMGPEEENNLGPYIACVDQKWVQVKKMDWSNYIEHGMDEGINCSKFKNQVMTDAVLDRIGLLEYQFSRSYQCPIRPKELEKAALKYQKYKIYLINTDGHIPVPSDKDFPE